MINKILEELTEAGAYEQEVNGKTEFLSGITYCISVIKKYMESEEINEEDTHRNIK